MTSAEILPLTDDDFDQRVLQSPVPMLIRFGASWCGPCRQLDPVLTAIAKAYEGQLVVCTVDIDAHPRVADRLGVRTIPTLFVCKDGKIVSQRIGAVPRKVLHDELNAVVRVPVEVPPEVVSLSPLTGFVARVALLADAPRAPVAELIRSYSAAAHAGSGALEQHIDAAHAAIRAMPALVAELQAAVRDEHRPLHRRLGTLAALLYGAAPLDGLPDELPGGYGFLDDWMVLSSAKWIYVRPPDASELAALAEHCRLVWLALPPAVIAPLAQFVAQMEVEAAYVAQLPEAQLQSLLAQLLAQPAPLQFALPPAQQAAASQPGQAGLGGWSQNAHGAMWGSGDGKAMYMRFEGGGSIGMVGDKIVGGP